MPIVACESRKHVSLGRVRVVCVCSGCVLVFVLKVRGVVVCGLYVEIDNVPTETRTNTARHHTPFPPPSSCPPPQHPPARNVMASLFTKQRIINKTHRSSSLHCNSLLRDQGHTT